MEPITVIVTTFGSRTWEELAWDRAIPNAQLQAETVSFHADAPRSLGDARNMAVDFHDPQGWLCFMDADDELEPGYMKAMRTRINHPSTAKGDLFSPSLRLVPNGSEGSKAPLEELQYRHIMEMNPCPIGTIMHRDTFEAAGRFWDEPAWEDWSLFRRAYILDASIHFVVYAVYRSYTTPHGRNSLANQHRGLHASIIRSHRNWALRR